MVKSHRELGKSGATVPFLGMSCERPDAVLPENKVGAVWKFWNVRGSGPTLCLETTGPDSRVLRDTQTDGRQVLLIFIFSSHSHEENAIQENGSKNSFHRS